MNNSRQNRFKGTGITGKRDAGKETKLNPYIEQQLTMTSYEKWLEARRARDANKKKK